MLPSPVGSTGNLRSSHSHLALVPLGLLGHVLGLDQARVPAFPNKNIFNELTG